MDESWAQDSKGVGDPTCAVVVCTTTGRIGALERCLRSVAVLEPAAHEVVVVDNTDGDTEVERLTNQMGARYVVESTPGLSRARNLGAASTDADLVAFIDDDAIAHSAWIGELVKPFRDPIVAATTGRVLTAFPESAGSPQWLQSVLEDLGPRPIRLSRERSDWFEVALFGGVGLGGNMAIRRSLFPGRFQFREDLGLPYPVLGEEHYLFFQLVRDGHHVAYTPDAVIEHFAVRDSEDPRHRKLRLLRGSTAFLVLLIVEERGYRLAAVRYGVEALAGRRRSWRWNGAGEASSTGPIRLLTATASGAWLYLRRRKPQKV